MIFVLQFVLSCIILIDIEESLHPWDKSHLVIVYEPFNMLVIFKIFNLLIFIHLDKFCI